MRIMFYEKEEIEVFRKGQMEPQSIQSLSVLDIIHFQYYKESGELQFTGVTKNGVTKYVVPMEASYGESACSKLLKDGFLSLIDVEMDYSVVLLDFDKIDNTVDALNLAIFESNKRHGLAE